MSITESLINLRSQISEESFQEIILLVEGSLFKADKRGDLFDDISKILTGKDLAAHLKCGTQKLIKTLKDKKKK